MPSIYLYHARCDPEMLRDVRVTARTASPLSVSSGVLSIGNIENRRVWSLWKLAESEACKGIVCAMPVS